MGSKLEEIRSCHPFPWNYVVHPRGLIQAFDSQGKEVSLFALLDLAVLVTQAKAEKTE